MVTHIFYVPHPDDETISMGTAILQKLRAGSSVYMVLLTDGKADETLSCLNGKMFCKWHNCYHNPNQEKFCHGEIDIEKFVNIRRQEFIEATKFLGVPESNIKIFGFPDMNLSKDDVKNIVMNIENDDSIPSPKYHHTMSYLIDEHNDHLAAGNALRELSFEGKINPPTWYIKQSVAEKIPVGFPYKEIAPQDDYDKYLLNSICVDVYQNFDPVKGFYGVGYHSTPKSFNLFMIDYKIRSHGIIFW